MSELEKKIEELINKAAASERADDAMRFSQAALNAAHAMQVMVLTRDVSPV